MIIKRLITYFLICAICLIINPLRGLSQEEGEKPTIPLDHFYAKPQKAGGLRKKLGKVYFSFETGYGRTYYRQKLDDFAILQQPDSLPLIFSKSASVAGGTVPQGYNYFFNDASGRSNTNFDPNSDFLVNADTAKLKFKAPGTGIPLTLMLHFEIKEKYKIGAGATFEYHRPGRFRSTEFDEPLARIKPNFGSAFYKKYFVILGAKVYRYQDYLLSVDTRIGMYRLGGNFNKSLIKKGIFANLGVLVEKDLSEYFRVFVRPSFDFKNYTLSLPESGMSVNTSMNALYLGVGVTYRIPELPKCFLKKCTIQINHQHGNSREYRSRMHPIYKRQNPHHGENYPSLIKYKRKNKKKLHAY